MAFTHHPLLIAHHCSFPLPSSRAPALPLRHPLDYFSSAPGHAQPFDRLADLFVIGDRHALRRRRNDERNRLVAALAIDGEISIQRTDMVVVVFLAHTHQAGVGERHRHIRILFP